MARKPLIVALGSSFAAGPTIEPVVDRAAMRSGRNYAHLLAEAVDGDLVDLTVSGATTTTILDEPQVVPGRDPFPPQIDGVPADADVVTVTAGGNDLDFLGEMLQAAWTRYDPTSPLTELLRSGAPEPSAVEREGVEAVVEGLTRIVGSVRERAPRARVVLVDYLTIVPDDEGPVEAFTPDEVAGFRALQTSLVEAYRTAAVRADAELLAVSELSRDHGLGSTDPWVFGFKASVETTAGSFHPNAAGMRAVADALVALLAD